MKRPTVILQKFKDEKEKYFFKSLILKEDNLKKISFSDKNNLLLSGISRDDSSIGVDIESLDERINEKSFSKNILHDNEAIIFEIFCQKYQVTHKEGLIIFWSFKESFFKALAMEPGLAVKDIFVKNFKPSSSLEFGFSKSLQFFMSQKSLRHHKVSFWLLGKYIISVCLIKQN